MQARFLVVSFSSDWLFTPAQSEAMVDALVANGRDVSYCNIASTYGHDAFLLEDGLLGGFISSFLKVTHRPDLRTGTRARRPGREAAPSPASSRPSGPASTTS